MYNKHNLAIHKIASKSQMQPQLSTVAFYGNRSVATDSFRLIEVSAWGDAHEPELFTAEAVKNIKLPRGIIKTTPQEQTIHKKLEGEKYPDVDIVIKEQMRGIDDPEKYATIHVNAELLEGLLSIMKKLDTYCGVTLSVPRDGNRALVITAETKAKGTTDKQTARAFLMPKVKR